MKFSVIVPVYNVENYIESCLKSILAQDFSDYEIVIVNDGSTDKSMQICSRVLKNTGVPVTIVSEPNSGLLQARRSGIKASIGDYLWHVDGDDYLAPNAMSVVSDWIDRAFPDLVLIGLSNSPSFDSLLPGTLSGEQVYYSGKEMPEVRLQFLAGSIPNLVMKIALRSCVDVEADYSEYGRLQLGEDQLQSIAILDKAKNTVCIRQPLYFYRPNPKSISSRYIKGQFDQYNVVKEAMYRQAVLWDKITPGYQFETAALVGYLANAFYDMRKNINRLSYRDQFEDLRDSKLYRIASKHRSKLRLDQRLFHHLVSLHCDFGAFCWLNVCRLCTSIARKIEK